MALNMYFHKGLSCQKVQKVINSGTGYRKYIYVFGFLCIQLPMPTKKKLDTASTEGYTRRRLIFTIAHTRQRYPGCSVCVIFMALNMYFHNGLS